MRKSSGGATKAVVGEADYLACYDGDLCYLIGEHKCEGRAKNSGFAANACAVHIGITNA
ncbi:hypothetical protein [Paraglaciecola sp. MB-3u-78]|uniref:hypothetical protein n=1 Tax=Paraglaciecola sp. MB-3u-78 TaxID=2058332 RepID=UPI0018E3E43B|nr:hypothetical protein [Paraglaciecola sp. MB-3u-78]